jgi:micrococcal nuclease
MKFLYAFNGVLLLHCIWVFFLSSSVSVVRVIDGDTFIAKDLLGREIRVRLLHIDAPEMGQLDKMGLNDRGKIAKIYLNTLIEGKSVELKNQSLDIYKRTLADVYVGESYINVKLVESGNALIYKKPKIPYLKDLYVRALNKAKHAERGFWRYGGIIRPKTFRRKRREKTRKGG